MEIVTIEEMRRIEREGFEAGTSYEAMVEMVGRLIAEAILESLGEKRPRITGLVGRGNNGADTIVAMRHLANAGLPVNVIFTADRGGDVYEKAVQRYSDRIYRYDQDGLSVGIVDLLRKPQIILDGIYGIGFHPPLPDSLRPLLQAVNQSQAKPIVFAIDCASGIDCDSGQADPDTIQADITIAVHRVKVGQLFGSGAEKTGRIHLIRMKLPPNLPVYASLTRHWMTGGAISQLLPARPDISNKGSFGTVRIFGGSEKYMGAPLMSAKAAYAVGAGLAEIHSTTAVRSAMASSLLEATWDIFPAEQEVYAWMERRLPDKARTAWLVGPGLSAEMAEAFHAAITELAGHGAVFPPLILDATILNCIKDSSKPFPRGTILTPHPGEMARMMGIAVSEVQSSRIEAAESLARSSGAVVVLKGAYTVIALPSGQTWVAPFANAALAKAGSGDVLAGTIAGFAAQLQDTAAAAKLGVWLHGAAAENYRMAQSDTRTLNPSMIPDGYAAVFADL